tara:strand:+ start:965 stop:1138 length:174 start_codon:yes stop_codon:yes gene_type:complete
VTVDRGARGKNMKAGIYKVGLRKPILGARVLHITINNRAWQKEALAKPIKVGSKKSG